MTVFPANINPAELHLIIGSTGGVLVASARGTCAIIAGRA